MSHAQFIEQAQDDVILAMFLAEQLGVSKAQIELWTLQLQFA